MKPLVRVYTISLPSRTIKWFSAVMREYDVSRLILTCRHFGKEILPFLKVSACDADERDGGCALPVPVSEKTSFRPSGAFALKD